MSRKIKSKYYALKGGVNLRFFFNSFRYSEDMDIDICEVSVDSLKDIVMPILQSPNFLDSLKAFTIERIIPPDITKAKQTETTQRFKVHLINYAGEDLFTKIVFSRRELKKGIIIEPASNVVLREYKLSPLLVPHYNISSTIMQKIGAVVSRTVTQARDIFDLYILSSQYKVDATNVIEIAEEKLREVHNNIFEISFEQFRDTVISYLFPDERAIYSSEGIWDEIKLKVVNFTEELYETKCKNSQ